jgi:hypothetical protein
MNFKTIFKFVIVVTFLAAVFYACFISIRRNNEKLNIDKHVESKSELATANNDAFPFEKIKISTIPTFALHPDMWHTSIAVNKSGEPVIGYLTGSCKTANIARFKSGRWITSQVAKEDSDITAIWFSVNASYLWYRVYKKTGIFRVSIANQSYTKEYFPLAEQRVNGIAFNPSNYAYVLTPSGYDLKCSQLNMISGDLEYEKLLSDDYLRFSASITVNDVSNPIVSFVDSSSNVHCASVAGGKWWDDIVAHDSEYRPNWTAVANSLEGNIGIAYFNIKDKALEFVSGSKSDWKDPEIIDTVDLEGDFILVFDSSGNPIVIYKQFIVPKNGVWDDLGLILSTRTDGKWNSKCIEKLSTKDCAISGYSCCVYKNNLYVAYITGPFNMRTDSSTLLKFASVTIKPAV